MEANGSSVLFLGTRGSVPVDGMDYIKYGGATSCVLARMGGETILLDAGSGLMDAREPLRDVTGTVHILLTHPHIDHIIGLPCFPLLYDPARTFVMMTAPRNGISTQAQLGALMNPPIWPVSPHVFAAKVQYTDIEEPSFMIGSVRVDTMASNHPGGCTLYRLTAGEDSVAYCTDFEHGGGFSEKLMEFATGASLLIFDASFSDEEYKSKIGWGHSTWEEGVRIAKQCGAKRLAITHHHPERKDAELQAAETAIQEDFPACFFAKSGLEVLL